MAQPYGYDAKGNRTHENGALTTIVAEDGTVKEERSFDPFGKPRKDDFKDASPAQLVTLLPAANDDLITTRGFTGHEHLDEVELIHMNGRVYDYNLGRFLSVDPFIQAPSNSQSMNNMTRIIWIMYGT